MTNEFECVVIGGGFYGCCIAAQFASSPPPGYAGRVCLIEQEQALMQRASYVNQARIHNGYHYPRSLTTALRSRVNLPRFVADWPAAVVKDFTKIYALARHNSKVNAEQFCRFCAKIGASLQPANSWLSSLFNSNLIEAVFVAQEYAFNTKVLAQWAREELDRYQVELRLGTKAERLRGSTPLELDLLTPEGRIDTLRSKYIFNCSYSALNQLHGFPGTVRHLKHELTEIALLQLPPALEHLGITVLDGPFFSLLPFPAREGLSSFTHVRYTPHLCWSDQAGRSPLKELETYHRHSHVLWMLRDATRYLPALQDSTHIDSLFEVKTVLQQNETDDGRPILLERYPELPGYFSVLGGKIDNIYDIMEEIYASLN